VPTGSAGLQRKFSTVAGNDAEPQPDLIVPLLVATQPRHLCSPLVFPDPLLRLAALVLEVDGLPVRELCVIHSGALLANSCFVGSFIGLYSPTCLRMILGCRYQAKSLIQNQLAGSTRDQ
jgi:hypothetical protein